MNTTASSYLPNGYQREKEKALKKRVEAAINVDKFLNEIDKIPLSNGARVVYFDAQLNSVILRDFDRSCLRNPPTVILREKPKTISTKEFASQLKTNERDSQIVGELISLTLNCSAAVISWVVVVGASASIPLTNVGGAAVVYLGYTAAAASAGQCFNSAVRVGMEIAAPEQKDWLDSNEWYTAASNALDVISVAGAGGSSVVIRKSLSQLTRSTGKTTRQVLEGLTRDERKRLTQDVIKLNNPNISKKTMKALIGSGKYPKRYSQQQINYTIAQHFKEALGASITVTGSLYNGILGDIAIGIYEQTIDL